MDYLYIATRNLFVNEQKFKDIAKYSVRLHIVDAGKASVGRKWYIYGCSHNEVI